jgi:hypothetical protein
MDIIIFCPHCKEQVLIEQLNCCIFRHGIKKNNFENINPHASKEECDYLINNNLIYGCGKPFKVIEDNITKKYIAIICDYI